MNIGTELKKERNLQGYTLVEVTAATGISTSFLSDIERGKSQPSLETLQTLAAFYDVSLTFGEAVIGDSSEYLREVFTERELRLMLNCVDYATSDPAGLPAHNLMVIVHKLLSTLRIYRAELVDAIGNEPH